MADAIVVLNAGSSSIKFSLFALVESDLDVVVRGQIEGLFTSPRFVSKDDAGRVLSEKSWGEEHSLGHEGALDHLVAYLRAELKEHRLVGVGHRIAHGGPEIAKPLRVDEQLVHKLEEFVPLAPLHQPHNLAPIRFLLERAPQLPQVACFDTSFHRASPPRTGSTCMATTRDMQRLIRRTLWRTSRTSSTSSRRSRVVRIHSAILPTARMSEAGRRWG